MTNWQQDTFEDIEAVIRSRKAVRTINAMAKKTNSDLQHITQKPKDRATRNLQ